MKHEITDLGFTAKAYNALRRSKVFYLEDLCNKTAYEVKRTRNLGNKHYKEVVNMMKEYGLSFKEEILWDFIKEI